MALKDQNPAGGGVWNIEIAPSSVSPEIRERYQQIENDAVGWSTRLVDFQLDQRRDSTDVAAVLHRVDAWREGENGANLSIKQLFDAEDHSNIDPKSAGQTIRTKSGHYTLWARRLTDRTRPGSQSGTGAADASDSATVQFGNLPSVRAMAGDEVRLVLGYDTEYVSFDDEGRREIVSYQFSWIDILDGSEHEVVILPLEGQRLLVEDCLYTCSLLGGFGRYADGFKDLVENGPCDMDPRGIVRSELGKKKLRDSLFKRASIRIVLAGHFLNVDATAFRRPKRRYDDILHKLTSAGGGLVSLQPVRVVRTSGYGEYRRLLGFSVIFRDTRNQASPDHKRLQALGDACGVEKLDVGDAIEDMEKLSREDLPRFLDYSANDARIVVHYLGTVWGYNIVPPVTISSGGAKALKAGIFDYWYRSGFLDSDVFDAAFAESGRMDNSIFRRMFQGLKTRRVELEFDSDSLAFYAVRGLEPVDGDARVSHALWADSFAGGYNTCPSPGLHDYQTYDWDLQSAYPTAMASIYDPDYADGGVIDTHIDKRYLALDDFPLGPLTPLVGYVSFVFPDGVEPCLPVRRGNSLIYPRTSFGCGFDEGSGLSLRLNEDGLDLYGDDRGGRDYTREQLDDIAARVNGDVGGIFHGATCAAPEIYLALKLGAKVFCQTGVVLKLLTREVGGETVYSRSLRPALRQMVVDRAAAKKSHGKKSLQELTLKVATNSCYGKLAQDVVDQTGWNAYEEEMENIGGSAVTSPYHASMVTSMVRATLLAVSNQTKILSATTDGVITADEDLERYDLFGFADILRESRLALADDDSIWEIKHRQSDLVNLSTRANVSCEPGGVLAKGNLRIPESIARGSVAEREYFRDLALSRTGKIPNPYKTFPSFQYLSRTEDRLDCVLVSLEPEISLLDYDLKREPIPETFESAFVGEMEICGFETRAWLTVLDYDKARSIAQHIQNHRPGATDLTGCLRTRGDWGNWHRRYRSAGGRRVRTAGSALLTEIVAAHKAGFIEVPELASKRLSLKNKLAWLSSLGLGEFSKSQWDNMSKTSRRESVLADCDLDEVRAFLDSLEEGVA